MTAEDFLALFGSLALGMLFCGLLNVAIAAWFQRRRKKK